MPKLGTCQKLNAPDKHPGRILQQINDLVYYVEYRNAARKIVHDVVNVTILKKSHQLAENVNAKMDDSTTTKIQKNVKAKIQEKKNAKQNNMQGKTEEIKK